MYGSDTILIRGGYADRACTSNHPIRYQPPGRRPGGAPEKEMEGFSHTGGGIPLSVTSTIRGVKSIDDLPQFLRKLMETNNGPPGMSRGPCMGECSIVDTAGQGVGLD